MDELTVSEAGVRSGWSPRMLRYLERVGLVEPARNHAGYRLFGAAELQRLRTLRELVARFDCGLSDVAFAQRMHDDESLQTALERWLEDRPARPGGVSASDWRRFEQEKHERLLATPEADRRHAARFRPGRTAVLSTTDAQSDPTHTPTTEIA